MTIDVSVVHRGTATARIELPGGATVSAAADLIIGRDDTCAVRLDDPSCSRHHATVTWTDGTPVLTDLSSTNGTYVDDRRLDGAHALSSGDVIRVGRTTMRFLTTPPASSGPTAATRTIVLPDTLPARAVLTEAERVNGREGHENRGFLSSSHGLMPVRPPVLSLPGGYEPWEDVVAQLPDLWRTLSVRRAIQAMPVLGVRDLPETDLLRAACILGMLAHSYHRLPPADADRLPEAVQQPWAEVSARLGRREPHLSYIDLIMYNWRLVDPGADDPMRLDNMRLLVPTVGNQEEEVFYLTQVEILARTAPVVEACIRAQEAVVADDPTALQAQLIAMTQTLQDVTFGTFMQIDPNARGRHHVDPVVWAKTVAPFAVPFRKGVAGPSGTAAPLFHLLDVFFDRHRYDTRFGEEMVHLRDWFPPHWQDLLAAIGQVSVADYVARGGRVLQGVHREATQAYAGDSGYLSRHRLKVYGFLDIGFKVGRNITITGFTGLFRDRTWDQVDEELAVSRRERQDGFPHASHQATVARVAPAQLQGDPDRWVREVVLDVSGTGLRPLPGDRCAVLPETGDALLQRTLAALQATGEEHVTLTQRWRTALQLREGFEGATTLPLHQVLRMGRVRPVGRAEAKALHAVTLDGTLGHILQTRAEDQWELWDLLDTLRAGGFDVTRLWRAHPGQREHVCRIVPPEQARMYSISAVEADAQGLATQITLTVGRLTYDTRATPVSRDGHREGTASHHLARHLVPPGAPAPVTISLVHPPRFQLPVDPRTRIVMVAGGTGIAPFRGFVQARQAAADPGEAWLLLACRTRSDLPYAELLGRAAGQGWLHLVTAFSRDDADTAVLTDEDGSRLEVVPGRPRRIGEAMLEPDTAESLRQLLRRGAHVYVCGRTGFATAVMDAVRGILTDDGDEDAAEVALQRLVAEGRYLQDVFTTYSGPVMDQQRVIPTSEVVLHNQPGGSRWMVVDGRVHDMTRFGDLHPGGDRIIQGYCGMDATIAYRRVLHDANPEVHSMLGMYEIGVVRRLDLGTDWGVAVGPNGLTSMSLEELYRSWARLLFTVVEMENALVNDLSVRDRPVTAAERPGSFSPLRLQLQLEVHERFLLSYLPMGTGPMLQNLWAATSGLCSAEEPVEWMQQQITEIASADTDTLSALSADLQARIAALVARGGGADDPAATQLAAFCALLEQEDTRFLSGLKMRLRDGILVFETHEDRTLRDGGHDLLRVIRSIPNLVAGYQSRLLGGAFRILLDHPDR